MDKTSASIRIWPTSWRRWCEKDFLSSLKESSFFYLSLSFLSVMSFPHSISGFSAAHYTGLSWLCNKTLSQTPSGNSCVSCPCTLACCHFPPVSPLKFSFRFDVFVQGFFFFLIHLNNKSKVKKDSRDDSRTLWFPSHVVNFLVVVCVIWCVKFHFFW